MVKTLKELICNERGVMTVADTILVAIISLLIGVGVYMGITKELKEGFNLQDSQMKKIKGGG